ncbi:MAG: hypothetical protein ABL888_00095 [Pirellulaceae bacterium]
MHNASSSKDLYIPALGRFRIDYDILWEGRVSLPGVGKVYGTLVSPPGKQPSAYTIKTLELFLKKWNAATYLPMIYQFFWQEWLKNKEAFLQRIRKANESAREILGRRARQRRIPRIQSFEDLRKVVRVCGLTVPIKARCPGDRKRTAGRYVLIEINASWEEEHIYSLFFDNGKFVKQRLSFQGGFDED